MFIFLLPHILSHCLGPVKTSTPKAFVKCEAPQFTCTLRHNGQRVCLGIDKICDGRVECDGGADEDNSLCGNSSNICNKLLHNFLWVVVEKYGSYLASAIYSDSTDNKCKNLLKYIIAENHLFIN